MKTLTDTAIRNAKPREKKYELADGSSPGLRLTVTPAARKTWVYRYRDHDGALRRVMLGHWPAMGLAEARSAWLEHRGIRDRHGDVRAVLGQRRAAAKAEQQTQQKAAERDALTVAKLVDAFVDHQSRVAKSWAETKRILQKDLVSRYGDRPAHSITRSDLQAMLAEVAERGLVAANRLRDWTVRAFNYGIDHGLIEASPAARLKKVARELPRDRVLTERELRELVQALLELEDRIVADILTVILYTGCRAGEALGYVSAQRDGLVWTLPITKNGRQHRIFLAKSALDALKRHESFGIRKERLAEVQRALVAELEHRRWTPHDLRRTFATWCAEHGATNELLDRLLNHSSASRVQKTYNTAQLDKPAREKWSAWAAYLRKLGRRR